MDVLNGGGHTCKLNVLVEPFMSESDGKMAESEKTIESTIGRKENDIEHEQFEEVTDKEVDASKEKET